MFLDLNLKDIQPLLYISEEEIIAYKANYKKIFINLEDYLLNEQSVIHAEEIETKIFPNIKADVFISHSHTDEKIAIKIALGLEKIGLKVFIDSCVWGYADELLEKIDNKFCKPDGWTNYHYKLRNRITSNVYIILNTALQRMIDQSELMLFLNSNNSVKIKDYIDLDKKEYLASPWIFSELTFSQRVRRTPRQKISLNLEEAAIYDSIAMDNNAIQFIYPLPKLSKEIFFDEFLKWLHKDHFHFDGLDKKITDDNILKKINGLMALDNLYQLIGVEETLLEDKRYSM